MKKYFSLKNTLRLVGVLNFATAVGIWTFWHNFYAGKLFDKQELAQLIPNFDGYYAWEISFTIPDIITSIFMALASLLVFFVPTNKSAHFVLSITTGAILFLGILDFNYGISTGLYNLPIDFAKELLLTGIWLPCLALFNILILWLARKI